MFDRRNTSMEMRTPAVLSAAVHVVALVAAIVNFNFFSRTPLEPEPVMVDFEMIGKKAGAPTIGNPPPQPKEAPIDKETTKAPPPKTADPPPAPEPPKPEMSEFKPPQPPKPEEKAKPEPPKPVEDKIAMKPKEPEPPKIDKPEPPKPKPTPEVKHVEPPKPAPPKPAPPKPLVDQTIDDLLKNKDSRTKIHTPEQQPKPVDKITRQAPQAPNLASVVTASEIEAVRAKVGQCWLQTPGLKNLNEVTVSIVVEMNSDGTPVKADLVDRSRYNSDPVYRSVADAGMRAVLNPRCQPWPLPMDKISSWRTITFNFSPRDFQ